MREVLSVELLSTTTTIQRRSVRNYFGRQRAHVCSFGFEANPAHNTRLRRLEAALRRQHHPVKIYTSTAVVGHACSAVGAQGALNL